MRTPLHYRSAGGRPVRDRIGLTMLTVLAVALVAASLAPALPVASAGTAGPADGTAGPVSAAASTAAGFPGPGQEHQALLPTGDMVTWHEMGGTILYDVAAAPRQDGREVSFTAEYGPGGYFVLPSDADMEDRAAFRIADGPAMDLSTADLEGLEPVTGEGGSGPVHTVTVRVIDPAGTRPLKQLVTVLCEDWRPGSEDCDPSYSVYTRDGVGTTQLPEGSYTFMAHLSDYDGDRIRGKYFLAETTVSVHGDTEIVLDAREAVELTRPRVPGRVVEERAHAVTLTRDYPGAGRSFNLATKTFGRGTPVYVSPTGPGVRLFDSWLLAEPQPLTALPADPDEQGYDEYWLTGPAPAYAYNLPYVYDQGVPASFDRRVGKNDLVEVPSVYHAERDDVVLLRNLNGLPVEQGIYASNNLFLAPGAVREYYLADDDLIWIRASHAMLEPGSFTDPAAWVRQIELNIFGADEAGSTRETEHWLRAPLRLGAIEIDEEYRAVTDQMLQKFGLDRSMPVSGARGGIRHDQFIPPLGLLDNTPRHWDTTGYAHWRMFAQPEIGPEIELVEEDNGWNPYFRLLPDETTYRLEADETWPAHADGVMLTKPTAHTEWTFTSRRPTSPPPPGYSCRNFADGDLDGICAHQDLIYINYDLDLDERNQAPAGQTWQFTIEARHHTATGRDPGQATVTAVAASFDAGRTWTGLDLEPLDDKGRYTATINHPALEATDSYVTLRVKAEDAGGGTVDQRIEHAYRLK